MLKASKRLVVISEKVNKYGFRTLVDGVDFSQYERNPIMLWMHVRPFGITKEIILPLGNVIELRVEFIDGEKVITGLPVFDDTDDFAVSIYNKFENGTLRMGSAGLIPRSWTDDVALLIEGQTAETLVKSILEEISIVDIGADNDALSVALYDENHNRIELSSNSENAAIPLLQLNNKIEMEKIELTAAKAAGLLGVSEIKTAEAFESKIAEVVQLAASQKTQIETLTREKSDLQTKLDEADEIQLSSKIETLVQGAVDARKITADEKTEYVTLARGNYESVEKLLSTKRGVPTIESQLAGAGKKDATVELYSKTYDELFESGDLVKVKLNAPVEYARIYKDKFGAEPKNN